LGTAFEFPFTSNIGDSTQELEVTSCVIWLDNPGRSGDLFSFIVSCSLLQNN